MTHLLGQVQYDKERKGTNDMERSISFVALGKLAIVAKNDIERYLDEIMQSVKDGLRVKRYQPRLPMRVPTNISWITTKSDLFTSCYESVDIIANSGQ